MAITNSVATSFKTEVLSGGHNFSSSNRALSANTADTFKIALYTSSATLNESTTAYTTTNEITNTAGSAYTAGGKVLTITQPPTAQSVPPTTTVYVDFADVSWTSATFTAAGALIYNASNGNKAVATLSFGGDKTVVSGTFTVTFPTPNSGASIVQIA